MRKTPTVTTRPAFKQPPAIIYPKPSKKPVVGQQPTVTRPTQTPPVNRPTKGKPTQLPSTPASNSTVNRKKYYPGLRPPASSNTTIVNRPTTVINQNTTNITNVNNWFNNGSWRNQVTINSNHWNGRPWWYRQDYRDWHHGHWHGRYYFRGRNSWSHIDSNENAWLNGLVAWGLGNLVYRSGYQVYANPYYSRPILVANTTIDYSRPICVQRSRYELLYQNNEEQAERLREQALGYFRLARNSFIYGNSAQALEYVNSAIALMPDDTSLHEFRSLALFTLGRYDESAETIHAVLAVAPGWDWTTLSGLYRDVDDYTRQLRDLESYIRANPRNAGARFLLAYHYITMGYPQYAETQLQRVLLLHPDDRLANDLLSLVREENRETDQFALLKSGSEGGIQLEGRWRARRPTGEIELELRDWEFKWDYDLAENDEKFGGKYEITGNMMLLATAEGSQMVGTVTQPDRDHFVFKLLGSDESDPGVEFVRN